MAMGIPVITNSGVGDIEEIVNKYKAGIVVPDFNKIIFDKLAEEIASGITFSKELIKQGASDYYSLEKAVAQYTELYAEILK